MEVLRRYEGITRLILGDADPILNKVEITSYGFMGLKKFIMLVIEKQKKKIRKYWRQILERSVDPEKSNPYDSISLSCLNRMADILEDAETSLDEFVVALDNERRKDFIIALVTIWSVISILEKGAEELMFDTDYLDPQKMKPEVFGKYQYEIRRFIDNP